MNCLISLTTIGCWIFYSRLTFDLLSKSFQGFKFGLTARPCLNRCKALTFGTKLATKANSWGIRGYRFSYLASNPFIWSKTTVGYLYSSAQSKVRKSLSRASHMGNAPPEAVLSFLFESFFRGSLTYTYIISFYSLFFREYLRVTRNKCSLTGSRIWI